VISVWIGAASTSRRQSALGGDAEVSGSPLRNAASRTPQDFALRDHAGPPTTTATRSIDSRPGRRPTRGEKSTATFIKMPVQSRNETEQLMRSFLRARPAFHHLLNVPHKSQLVTGVSGAPFEIRGIGAECQIQAHRSDRCAVAYAESHGVHHVVEAEKRPAARSFHPSSPVALCAAGSNGRRYPAAGCKHCPPSQNRTPPSCGRIQRKRSSVLKKSKSLAADRESVRRIARAGLVLRKSAMGVAAAGEEAFGLIGTSSSCRRKRRRSSQQARNSAAGA